MIHPMMPSAQAGQWKGFTCEPYQNLLNLDDDDEHLGQICMLVDQRADIPISGILAILIMSVSNSALNP